MPRKKAILVPFIPFISASVFPLSGTVVVAPLPSEFVPSPAVILIITVSHLSSQKWLLHFRMVKPNTPKQYKIFIRILPCKGLQNCDKIADLLICK